MGRLLPSGDIIIQELISAGPGAKHLRHGFEPDEAWQWTEMERIHLRDGGVTKYIGDWHSHPNAKHGGLSGTDLAALRTILLAPESHADKVVSLVLCGGPSAWHPHAWLGALRRKRLPWRQLQLEPLRVGLSTDAPSQSVNLGR